MNPTQTPEEVIQEQVGDAADKPPFSLELSQDQKDVREWVHGFAENVVRPAAHEWDEKEEFPWPVVQEAAKIGLYGFEGVAQFFADESGLSLPIVNEELFWGDAGIGMAIIGFSRSAKMGVSAIVGLGNKSDIDEDDLLAFFEQDPNTNLIAQHCEDLKDGRAFAEAAKRDKFLANARASLFTMPNG